MELYKRLKYGDLQDRYQNEVINSNPDDRDAMIAAMNIMCGNIDTECYYAAYHYSMNVYFDSSSGKFYFL